MRKFLISLLLASAAASPAVAAPNDWSDRQQANENKQQAREDRQQAREERQAAREQARTNAAQRPVFVAPRADTSVVRQEAIQRPQFSRSNRPQPQVDASVADIQRRDGQSSGAMRAESVEQVQRRFEQQRGAIRTERLEQIQQGQQGVRTERDLRQSDRPLPNVMRTRNRLIVSEVPRPGTQPPMRTQNRRSPSVHWNTNWRNSHHYDWREYRRHHRSVFHVGIYYDPFGWGYQPYSIGWRLWPSYYSRNYWITDPWMYRLPYAPPGYVWVRYWNDALLVDTWTGEVVDMIPNFFW